MKKKGVTLLCCISLLSMVLLVRSYNSSIESGNREDSIIFEDISIDEV